MKRKLLSLFLIIVFLICAFLTGACNGNDDEDNLKCRTDFTITGQKTAFSYGESFIFGEDVQGGFSDGTKKILTESNCTVNTNGFDKFKCGQYKITVSFGDLISEYAVTVSPLTKLKFLIIGNSYSDDTNRFMADLTDGMNLDRNDVKICNLFHGGCSITSHWNHKGEEYYHYRNWFDKTTTSKNDTDPYESTLEYGVKQERWDYIVFQQASQYSGKKDSYGHLPELIEYVETVFKNSPNYNPDVKFVFNMTWAYKSNYSGISQYGTQDEMYRSIVDAVNSEIVTNDKIVLISPAGTAIQNARTSYLGDTMNRDGTHLSKPVGCVISAMTMFCTLTGYQPEEINYDIEDLTKEDEKRIIVESVRNALDNNFVCTHSAITE